jgi:chromosome segregation ATPase
MKRWIRNDTETRQAEDGDAGFEIAVVGAEDYDQAAAQIQALKTQVAEARGQVAEARGQVAQARGQVALLLGQVARLLDQVRDWQNYRTDVEQWFEQLRAALKTFPRARRPF